MGRFFPKFCSGVGGLIYTKPATGNAHFCAFDGNGNLMALVDGGTGNVSAEYAYGAFGEPIRATGTMATSNPFRFSTKFTDDESDFLYYGYRYLNPSTGRWVSRDLVLEKGGVNVYGMVGNKPVEHTDYLGLTQVPLFDIWQLSDKGTAPDPCCGAFLILEMKGINVPPEQQTVAPTPTLDGFKVIYLACPTCECPINKIRLVQTRRWGGFLGRFPPEFDKGNQRPVPGEVSYPPYPGYTDPNTGAPNIIDGPYNPIQPNNTFYSEVCAVCKSGGKDQILGCVTFSFDGGTRRINVDGGQAVPPEDMAQFGGSGRSGGVVGNRGFSKGCSSPGKLWREAERKWLH